MDLALMRESLRTLLLFNLGQHLARATIGWMHELYQPFANVTWAGSEPPPAPPSPLQKALARHHQHRYLDELEILLGRIERQQRVHPSTLERIFFQYLDKVPESELQWLMLLIPQVRPSETCLVRLFYAAHAQGYGQIMEYLFVHYDLPLPGHHITQGIYINGALAFDLSPYTEAIQALQQNLDEDVTFYLLQAIYQRDVVKFKLILRHVRVDDWMLEVLWEHATYALTPHEYLHLLITNHGSRPKLVQACQRLLESTEAPPFSYSKRGVCLQYLHQCAQAPPALSQDTNATLTQALNLARRRLTHRSWQAKPL